MILSSTRLVFAPLFPLSTALWSSRPSHAQPILSFPHNFLSSQVTDSQKPSTELSDEFGRVSSRSSTRSAVTLPVRNDTNVEKTRSRTLGGVKGRASGAVANEEEIVVPDCSLFPLNIDPDGGEPASPSDSERGPYLLHLSSLITFLPHHHRHHSLSKRWSQSCVFLEIVNAVPARRWRASLVCPHRDSCFRPGHHQWGQE